MKNYLKLLFLGSFLFLITGCADKTLTVKTLQPAKISKEKIYTVKVDYLANDDVNQTARIEDKIATTVVEGKNTFLLKENLSSVDAVISGEVLESSLRVAPYHRTEVDYRHCRYYRPAYRDKHGNYYPRECIEYVIRVIPCEQRDYHLITNIKITKPYSGNMIFTKTYSRSNHEDECFDDPYYHGARKTKFSVNSILADEIANELMTDISPHYLYYDIHIIDELDEDYSKFTKEQEKKFEYIVDLMEKRNLEVARVEWEKLNQEFQNRNGEVLYNLALTYEAIGNLGIANNIYRQAYQITKNPNHLKIISFAISRTSENMEQKIKAKSQLP